MYVTEIGDDLKSMQQVVGGLIEAVYFEEDVLAALVVNEEGKMEGLPLNRALRDDSGEIYDVIAGVGFICGLSDENFASLSDELIEKLLPRFLLPEVFMRVDGKIVALKDDHNE
ncbi:hypothetical protein FACS1894184_18030 [Clostridia bacterium]|nr:hypothetical protein FACS1894184_18030 [Clostridia bacterium]